jgi:hypothetical protein
VSGSGDDISGSHLPDPSGRRQSQILSMKEHDPERDRSVRRVLLVGAGVLGVALLVLAVLALGGGGGGAGDDEDVATAREGRDRSGATTTASTTTVPTTTVPTTVTTVPEVPVTTLPSSPLTPDDAGVASPEPAVPSDGGGALPPNAAPTPADPGGPSGGAGPIDVQVAYLGISPGPGCSAAPTAVVQGPSGSFAGSVVDCRQAPPGSAVNVPGYPVTPYEWEVFYRIPGVVRGPSDPDSFTLVVGSQQREYTLRELGTGLIVVPGP